MQPFWAPTLDTDGQALGYEGETYSTNPWEFVVIGGDNKTPGIGSVKAAPSFIVDAQKSSGADASRLILRGYKPGDIEIQVMIWTPAQWEKMQEIIANVWRKPNKTSKLDLLSTGKHAGDIEKAKENRAIKDGDAAIKTLSLTISHPSIAPFGIANVVPVGFSPIEDGPIPQSKIIRLRCIEHIPGETTDRATRKVSGSKHGKKLENVVGNSGTAASPFNASGPSPGTTGVKP